MVLPLAVPPLAGGGDFGIFAAFWLTFAGDSEAALAISMSTVYALVFFAVPYLMVRMAAKHGLPPGRRSSLSDFLNGDFETITGRISGWSALVQVALVPVALAFGTLAIGVIYTSAR